MPLSRRFALAALENTSVCRTDARNVTGGSGDQSTSKAAIKAMSATGYNSQVVVRHGPPAVVRPGLRLPVRGRDDRIPQPRGVTGWRQPTTPKGRDGGAFSRGERNLLVLPALQWVRIHA